MRKAPHRFLLLFTLLVGFALRLSYLSANMYNPDEGGHIFAASAPDWRSVLARNFIDISHPPFIVLLAHILLQWHDAIWVPRLAGVIAGTALAFAGYHLGKAATGQRSVGLMLAIIFSFSPSFTALAVVVRGYIYMLLFMVAGLVFYFRYRRKERLHDLFLYMSCMGLAILSEYCVSFAIFACGIFQITRFWRSGRMLSHKNILWVFGHLLLAGWFLSLYFQHSFTRGDAIWLNDYYYIGHNIMGSLLVLLFYPFIQFDVFVLLAGMCAVASVSTAIWKSRGDFIQTLNPQIKTVLWLLALMIILAVTADALRLYPVSYGRHNIYLAPFFLLPILYALGKFLSRHAPLSLWLPGMALAYIITYPSIASREFMLPVSEIPPLQTILRSLPKGSTVFIDAQGHFMLFKSDAVDRMSETPEYITLHAGDTSLVRINQPALRMRAAAGQEYGNFFLTPEDLIHMLNNVAPGQSTLYLMEIGFMHAVFTKRCEPEAKALLHPIYQTPYVQLYSFTRVQGKKQAETCIARLSGKRVYPLPPDGE